MCRDEKSSHYHPLPGTAGTAWWEPFMPRAHSTPVPVFLFFASPLFLSYFAFVPSSSAALSPLIPAPVPLVWDANTWLAAFPESDYSCFCKNYSIPGLASSNDWNRATHTPLNQADTKIIIFLLYFQCLSLSLLWLKWNKKSQSSSKQLKCEGPGSAFKTDLNVYLPCSINQLWLTGLDEEWLLTGTLAVLVCLFNVAKEIYNFLYFSV